jgi:GTP-binding protein
VVRVAVVGRPNVGKSTLVNRLAGRNQAIAHESAGVTRDRLEVPVRWGARSLVLVDTGGYVPRARGIDAAIVRQATRAMDTAALALLVVDVSSGIAEEDVSLARALQKASRPVLVVANKVDSQAQEPLAAEFHALGLGEPVPVSALYGRGAGELLDRVRFGSAWSGGRTWASPLFSTASSRRSARWSTRSPARPGTRSTPSWRSTVEGSASWTRRASVVR